MSRRILVLRWRTPLGEAKATRVVRGSAREGLIELHRGVDVRIMADPSAARRVGGMLLLGGVVGSLDPVGALAMADPERAARLLVATCWGSYVAVLLGGDGIRLLADPSGAGRLHLCGDRDLAVASDVVDPPLLLSTGLPREVLADVLAGGLVDPTTLILGSALRGVECLAPGTLVHIDRKVPDCRVWTPASYRGRGRHRPDGDRRILGVAVDEAVAGLRGTHPLVQVFGGFDSAVVLATAAAAGPAIAFTVAGAAGDVDESSYAREAADMADVRLVVGSDEDLPSMAAFMDAPQGAGPYLHGLDDVFDRQMQDAVERHGCDRVLTGQGGDAVFMQPRSFAPAADRFADLGLRGLLAGVADDARRARSSIWQPLAAALLPGSRRSLVSDPPLLTPHLLTAEALRAARRDHHPWTSDRDKRRPGRALQARLLANATVVHTPRPRPPSVPIVHPLLAQPVLEAVLRVPAWSLASGRTDRGLARRTFADRLPRSVLERVIKGQASAYFSHGVVGQLGELRERLLDGRLVDLGVLDRRTLDGVLTRDHLAHSADYRSLMFVASCEAWAKAWT